jgi:DUF4097 and DUF4098 domain-containing protein YvlB
MNTRIRSKWMLAISALLVLSLGGCILICSSCTTPKYKAERTVIVSADMMTEALLSAQTNNGNIKVQGRPSDGFEVTANIIARADTEQEAGQLAEAVVVSLVPSQQGLVVDIKKPDSGLSKYISVGLDIKMPAQNRLDLKTSNGNIDISDIDRDVVLHTSNGNIDVNRTSGPITAHTSNGSVDCRDTGKDIGAYTSNGNISVVFNENAEAVNRIDLETSNGSIHITTPKSFSAKVDASTSNGKIRSNKSIAVQGDISEKDLHGTIGDGRGVCRLHTSNGSISIH